MTGLARYQYWRLFPFLAATVAVASYNTLLMCRIVLAASSRQASLAENLQWSATTTLSLATRTFSNSITASPLYIVGNSGDRVGSLLFDSSWNVTHFDRVMPELIEEWQRDGKLEFQTNQSISHDEIAATLSHLKAIQRAYDDGHEMVLIVDDSAFQNSAASPFKLDYQLGNEISKQRQMAPIGWHVLQLRNTDSTLRRHLHHLVDPWISWQADHSGATDAYLVSRSGMQKILSRTLFKDNGNHIWRLPEHSIVSRQETIFYLAQNSYTSTADLLQLHQSSPITTSRPKAASYKSLQQSRSILVIMSVRIQSIDEMSIELQRLRQDHAALCSLYQSTACDWSINLVLTKEELRDAWNQRTNEEVHLFPDSVKFHIDVTTERFNKFAFVARQKDRMPQYDFVLLKDNDQRLAGFPWATFIEATGDATVSGPLRQDVEESLERSKHRIPDGFPFHHGPTWKQSASLSSLYVSVEPLEVPFIEMYLVLFRGDFAHWFFSQVLTRDFLEQPVAWGPDFLWCAAARDFRPDAPSCWMVPVVSTHEDTRQIHKNEEFRAMGKAVLDRFRETSPTLARWMSSGQDKWKPIIKNASLKEIRKRCRANFNMPVFNLYECARKAAL